MKGNKAQLNQKSNKDKREEKKSKKQLELEEEAK